MEGVIKKILPKGGYGFIQSEELPQDLFFHFSAVEWGITVFNNLVSGQKVTFEVTKWSKPGSKQAVNICLIEEGGEKKHKAAKKASDSWEDAE